MRGRLLQMLLMIIIISLLFAIVSCGKKGDPIPSKIVMAVLISDNANIVTNHT
jgi:hypothetical protein